MDLRFSSAHASLRFEVPDTGNWPRTGITSISVDHPNHRINHSLEFLLDRPQLAGLVLWLRERLEREVQDDEDAPGWVAQAWMPLAPAIELECYPPDDPEDDAFEMHLTYAVFGAEDVGPGYEYDAQQMSGAQYLHFDVGFMASRAELEIAFRAAAAVALAERVVTAEDLEGPLPEFD